MAIKVKKLLYIIAAFKEHLIDTWLLAKKVGGGGVLLAKNVEKMLNFIVLFWEKIVEQMHNFIVVFWGKNRLRGRERVLSICDTFWAQSHDLLSAKKSEKIIDIICAFYDIGGEGGVYFPWDGREMNPRTVCWDRKGTFCDQNLSIFTWTNKMMMWFFKIPILQTIFPSTVDSFFSRRLKTNILSNVQSHYVLR